MDRAFYEQLTDDALAGRPIAADRCEQLITDPEIDLTELLHAAYRVRKHYWGKAVQVHILNNAQNGACPEDCAYCTQAHTSDADIETYPIKDMDEVMAEAKRAYEAGAYRYCLVFAGRGPNSKRTDQLVGMVQAVKQNYPSLQICVSAGLLDMDKASRLAEAGVDRYNHNLNTSEENYANICSTHTYGDRVDTLQSARGAGMKLCSGLIAGMGETPSELVEVALRLRELGSDSIPVNFLLPFEGNRLQKANELSPELCLRILCLYRFTNPSAELRCAAGREFHLRSLEVMCLQPANSIFLGGYLNGRGEERRRTYQMIRDAGFTIESDHPLDELLQEIEADTNPDGSTGPPPESTGGDETKSVQVTFEGKTNLPGRPQSQPQPEMKTLSELRPAKR